MPDPLVASVAAGVLPANTNAHADANPAPDTPAAGSGMLLLPGLSVSSVVTWERAYASDETWLAVAQPLQRLHGYLTLPDRVALLRVSKRFAMLFQRIGDTTLEHARVVVTLSQLRRVLARCRSSASDEAARGRVLMELISSLDRVPGTHRSGAWQAVAEACRGLVRPAQLEVLSQLATAGPAPLCGRLKDRWLEWRARVDRMARAEARRAMAVPTHAAAGEMEPVDLLLQTGAARTADSAIEAVGTASLAASVQALSMLPVELRQVAVGAVLRAHFAQCSAGQAWQRGCEELAAVPDPQTRALALCQLISEVMPNGFRAAEAARDHAATLGWLRTQLLRLPADDAALVIATVHDEAPDQPVWEAVRSQLMDEVWHLGRTGRVGVQSLCAMLSPLGFDALPYDRLDILQRQLLALCVGRGLDDQRKELLAAVLDASLANSPSPGDTRERWRTALRQIGSMAPSHGAVGHGTPSLAALAAACYSVMAGRLRQCQRALHPVLSAELVAAISALPPASREQPVVALLRLMLDGAPTWFDGMLAAAPLPVQVAWRAEIVGLPNLSAQQAGPLLGDMVAATRAAADAGQLDPERLSLVLRQFAVARMHFSGGSPDTRAPLAGQLYEIAAALVPRHDASLSDAMGHFGIATAELAARSSGAVAQRCATVSADAARWVAAQPVDARLALLQALIGRYGSMMHGGEGAEPATVWLTDAICALPPECRAAALRGWVRESAIPDPWDRTPDQQWAGRRPVWHAIMTLPADLRSSLLEITRTWFVPLVPDRDEPPAMPDWHEAGRQWRAAAGALPENERI